MFNKVKGGSEINIQGVACQLPPVGYGVNRVSGKLEYIGVYKRSGKKSEQKWERITLPSNYKKMLDEEKAEQDKQRKKAEIKGEKIEKEDEYSDERLDKIRAEHWRYRLCGFWFMNNGVPTYLTGTHWFYLNWCSSNIGYMDYRNTDRYLFYVIAHTDESPVAGGVVFVGRRQCGKTYMANAWMLDRISLFKNKHGGIQSKAESDSSKVFNKLVNSFVDLPEFFKPTYDKSQGLRPKDTLRFFATNIKGKQAEMLANSDEMRSYIDFGTNKSNHYDGDESMYAYILDEFGKKQQSDIMETWNVVRPCIDKEGRWFGKAFVCSTIEEMDEVGEGPLTLWKGSNQLDKNENGRTETGLYRVFFGAQETTYFDDYGNPLIDKALKFHDAERNSKKDTRSLSSYKRKNPYTIDEAFRIDGDKCVYDSEKLNDQLDKLSWGDNFTSRGNFVWKDGKRDTTVVWEPSKNGRWEARYLFEKPEQSNKIEKFGNVFRPANYLKFVAAGDPFSHDVVVDNRRSDGACCVKMKFDAVDGTEYNDSFVCTYLARPETASIYYEDMIKTVVYYGCQILFENNKNNWKDYFISRGYEAFLMKLPGYADYGIPANKQTHQQLMEVTEEYIYRLCDKVFFRKIIEQWLQFEPDNTTPYDMAMAAGWCLIADGKKLYSRAHESLRNISEYGFKKRKIA